jgi:hypothetical protein
VRTVEKHNIVQTLCLVWSQIHPVQAAILDPWRPTEGHDHVARALRCPFDSQMVAVAPGKARV